MIISSTNRLVCALILLSAIFISQASIAQTTNDSENRVGNLDQTLNDAAVNEVVEAIEALPFTSQPLYRATGVLNFRASLSPNSKILDQIPDGFGALHIVERQGKRARVRYCRKEGWVSLSFLQKQSVGERRKQDCRGELYDPFPIVSVTDEVEDIQIDSTLIVGENQRIDATELERDLGQATLSPTYSVCLSDADGNAKKQSFCLDQEYKLWDQDMNIAFNLVAATLPFNQMKILRDSQRIWKENQKKLCIDLGLEEAVPFSRYHIPTCKLKLTFQRAIGLEKLLQDSSGDFERRLFELDVPLSAE